MKRINNIFNNIQKNKISDEFNQLNYTNNVDFFFAPHGFIEKLFLEHYPITSWILYIQNTIVKDTEVKKVLLDYLMSTTTP